MKKASGCASTFVRLLTYLLATLLVIALPLSILSNNALRTFFSPDAIGESVANLLLLRGGLRDQLTDSLVSDAWSELASPRQGEAFLSLTPQDRLKIAQLLFPQDWVSDQVRDNLRNIIEWVESEEHLPKLTLDLDPLRVQLQDGGSNRIAEIMVDSWPKCTEEQVTQLERALQQDPPARFDFCRPEGELHQRLLDLADQQLQQFIKNIPADIPLLEEIDPGNNNLAFDDFRRNMLSLLLILRWIRLFPFLFLGLIMTFAVRSWRGLGRWWGIPLAAGALLAILLILVAHGIGPGILKDALSQPEQPLEIQELIHDAAWGLIASVLNRSALQALFTLVIGVVLFAIPQLSKKKGSKPIPPSTLEDGHEERVEEILSPPQVEPFDPDAMESSREEDPPPGVLG